MTIHISVYTIDFYPVSHSSQFILHMHTFVSLSLSSGNELFTNSRRHRMLDGVTADQSKNLEKLKTR